MIIEEIITTAKVSGHGYQWYIGGLAVPAPRRLFPDSALMNPTYIEWSRRDSEEISDAWKKIHGGPLSLPAVTFPFSAEALRTDGETNLKKITVVRDDGQFLAFKAYLSWDVGDESCNIKLVAMPMDGEFPWSLAFKIEEALA